MKKILILMALMFPVTLAHADTTLEIKVFETHNNWEMTVEKLRETYTKCEVVRISGIITPEAAANAAGMIRSLEKCDGHKKVYLDSPGGYTYGGVKLGELFKRNKIHASIKEGDECGSACALAYLGGRKRTLEPEATLWFHQPYSSVSGATPHCFPGVAKQLKGYIKEMLGFNKKSKAIGDKAMEYCGEEIWTVSADEAKKYGITTHDSGVFRE